MQLKACMHTVNAAMTEGDNPHSSVENGAFMPCMQISTGICSMQSKHGK